MNFSTFVMANNLSDLEIISDSLGNWDFLLSGFASKLLMALVILFIGFVIIVGRGIISSNKTTNVLSDQEKINEVERKPLDLSPNYFLCFDKKGAFRYKTRMKSGCEGNITLTEVQFNDHKYINKLWKKYRLNKPSSTTTTTTSSTTTTNLLGLPTSNHCLLSNGRIYYSNKYCKNINNETIVGITKEQYADINKKYVDWVDVFILNGGDPSKIVKNDKETEKLIVELQKQLLEQSRNMGATDAETNAAINKIARTRDLKTLACIFGGNFNLLNILEFIEDCY